MHVIIPTFNTIQMCRNNMWIKRVVPSAGKLAFETYAVVVTGNQNQSYQRFHFDDWQRVYDEPGVSLKHPDREIIKKKSGIDAHLLLECNHIRVRTDFSRVAINITIATWSVNTMNDQLTFPQTSSSKASSYRDIETPQRPAGWAVVRTWCEGEQDEVRRRWFVYNNISAVVCWAASEIQDDCLTQSQRQRYGAGAVRQIIKTNPIIN